MFMKLYEPQATSTRQMVNFFDMHIYLFIYLFIYLCIYVFMYLCMYLFMYLCIYVFIYLFIYLFVRTCTWDSISPVFLDSSVLAATSG